MRHMLDCARALDGEPLCHLCRRLARARTKSKALHSPSRALAATRRACTVPADHPGFSRKYTMQVSRREVGNWQLRARPM